MWILNQSKHRWTPAHTDINTNTSQSADLQCFSSMFISFIVFILFTVFCCVHTTSSLYTLTTDACLLCINLFVYFFGNICTLKIIISLPCGAAPFRNIFFLFSFVHVYRSSNAVKRVCQRDTIMISH